MRLESESYVEEIFRQLVKKALAVVGLDRLTRAASAAEPGRLDSDGRRILEACRTFIFDCLEPPLEGELQLARLAGTAPSLVPFRLPDDLRASRRVASSLRLWLDYREVHGRAKAIMTGPRRARVAGNLKLTIRESFPELASEDLVRLPASASELGYLVVARRHDLEASTVKRRVGSIPRAYADLLESERAAFNGDTEVLGELRRRLMESLMEEFRTLTTESIATPSSPIAP